MRVAVAFLAVVVVAGGCGGPRPGAVYGVNGRLYKDEADFRAAVERHEAGVSTADEGEFRLMVDRQILPLGGASEVKVIEAVPGGARVVVTFGDAKGQIGWMLAEDLKDYARR